MVICERGLQPNYCILMSYFTRFLPGLFSTVGFPQGNVQLENITGKKSVPECEKLLGIVIKYYLTHVVIKKKFFVMFFCVSVSVRQVF